MTKKTLLVWVAGAITGLGIGYTIASQYWKNADRELHEIHSSKLNEIDSIFTSRRDSIFYLPASDERDLALKINEVVLDQNKYYKEIFKNPHKK